MVKRIRKRVSKAEDGVAGVADEEMDEGAEGEGGEPGSSTDAFTSELAVAATEDRFTQRTAGLFKWVLERRALLVGLTVLTVVIVAGYVLVQRSSTSKAAEATAAWTDGLRAYEKLVEGASAEGDLDLAAQRAHLERAQEAYSTARQRHADTRVAALAALGQAGAELELGRAAEAVALYDDVLARPGVEPFARAIATQGRATALDAKGDLDAAIAAWKQLAVQDAKAFGLISQVHVARLLRAKGDKAAARAAFETINRDFAVELGEMRNRILKSEVERELARLGDGAS